MHYLYFYYCSKPTSLNTTKNTNLRGIDITGTTGLAKKTVKTHKNTKLTWDKGKWWYRTDDYINDMNEINKPDINFSTKGEFTI